MPSHVKDNRFRRIFYWSDSYFEHKKSLFKFIVFGTVVIKLRNRNEKK